MWQTIKRRAARLGAVAAIDRARAREASLRLTLPNPYGGPAWATATVALSSRPRGMGEAVRLRGHIDSCFRMPAAAADRGALSRDDATRANPLARHGRKAAASLARRAVERLPRAARVRLAEQRRQSWIDMQISTAPLDAGAAALMPEPLRAVYGDRLPQASPGGPRIGVWSGPAGGARGGMARLAMVQFDQNDSAGSRGDDENGRFSLNLSIAEVVEPAAGNGTDTT
ncbi:hypothetical protein [Salinisphaera sp.]|uniref:hypothetical protein n=1 Tax=Salinisphaera sp. TaxID=1914330 RepID=UPI002D791CD3|nr:hypothetical protein [Salinisphaera sp.]HET7313329.1 hypothetical protein [Salinisphaera sp.]